MQHAKTFVFLSCVNAQPAGVRSTFGSPAASAAAPPCALSGLAAGSTGAPSNKRQRSTAFAAIDGGVRAAGGRRLGAGEVGMWERRRVKACLGKPVLVGWDLRC